MVQASDSPDVIQAFMAGFKANGVTDSKLPITEDNEHDFLGFRQSDETLYRRFLGEQWKFATPFFHDSELRHSFHPNHILPILKTDQTADCDNGYFSWVEEGWLCFDHQNIFKVRSMEF